jgi:voltage-gated potassium channel Kch
MRTKQVLRRILKDHPYRNLFVVLVLYLALGAIRLPPPTERLLSEFCFAFVLATALFETVRSKRHAVVAAILGFPAVFSRLFYILTADHPAADNAILVLSILFMAFLIWNLLHDLLMADRPSGERIFGALSAYLFIGILFALLYTHIFIRDPGAFSLPDHITSAGEGVGEGFWLTTFMYFSFVTLTTLGFGDISPVTDHARTLVYIEALVGQLFLAVMVAGFVGVSFAEAAEKTAAPTGRGDDEDSESSDVPRAPSP